MPVSAFLYYASSDQTKTSTATSEEFAALGLSHVFDDYAIGRGVSSGPDSMQGHVFSLSTDSGKFKYVPEQQVWKQMGKDGPWVGFWKDSKPTPAELAREHQLTGEWVQMDDGTRWLVPHAREWIEDGENMFSACKLPQRFTLNDAGDWVLGEIKSRYQNLWDLLVGYELAIAGGEQRDGMVHFQYDHITEFAVAALTANYRIGKHEANTLGILDQESRTAIIEAARDTKTWSEWAKKKLESAPDGDRSSDGPGQLTPDSRPPTAPHSRTSVRGKKGSTPSAEAAT